jgi:hypothetical protein
MDFLVDGPPAAQRHPTNAGYHKPTIATGCRLRGQVSKRFGIVRLAGRRSQAPAIETAKLPEAPLEPHSAEIRIPDNRPTSDTGCSIGQRAGLRKNRT